MEESDPELLPQPSSIAADSAAAASSLLAPVTGSATQPSDDPTPFVVNGLPPSIVVPEGRSVDISGVSISGGIAGGDPHATYSVMVEALGPSLKVEASGVGVSEQGADVNIVGSLAQVNADLATLSITALVDPLLIPPYTLPLMIFATSNDADAVGAECGITVDPVDPGPTAGNGAVTEGHDQTVSLTALISGLITPGVPGDTETLTSVSASKGDAVLGPDNAVTYTAPATGPDTITYTVTDQNDDSATGQVAVTVDPGPIAGNGAVTEGQGQTVSLTALIDGLITLGLPGDIETLTTVSASKGDAILGPDNAVTYTAPVIGPDTITYTVADQYGDTATGNVVVTVDPAVLVISAPSAASILQGTITSVVVSLSENGNTPGETFTVTLTDGNGDLWASGPGVSGSGTASLTITGPLAQVNEDLLTFGVTETASAADTIIINAQDSFGNTAVPQQVAVNVDAPLIPANVKSTLNNVSGAVGTLSDYLGFLSMIADGPAKLAAGAAIWVTLKTISLTITKSNQFSGHIFDFTTGLEQTLQETLGYIETVKTNPTSLALSLLSTLATATAAEFSLLAADPPATNFTKIVPPPDVSFPLPSPLLDDPNAGLLSRSDTDLCKLMSVSEAELYAAENYSGAVLAGDSTSAALQAVAFHQFTQEVEDDSGLVTVDLNQLASALPSVDASDFPNYQTQIINAINAQTGTPLPADLASILTSTTGLGQSTLTTLQAQVTIDPNIFQNTLQTSIASAVDAISMLPTPTPPTPMFSSPQQVLSTFGASPSAGGWGDQATYPVAVGDVNGDGMADIVGFGASGVYVSLATGGGNFAQPILGIDAFGADAGWGNQDAYPLELGDVTGNGRDDIVGFGSAGIYVSLANGDGTFAQPILGINAFGTAGGWGNQDAYPLELGDVTGNGRDDIIGLGAAGVYVSLANGDGTFSQPIFALDAFGADGGWGNQSAYPIEMGDVTGNGRDDIVGFGSAGVYVSLANGDGTFAQPILALDAFGADGGWGDQQLYPIELADVLGNGRDDIVAFGAAGVYVALANRDGTFAQPTLVTSSFGAAGGWSSQNEFPRLLGDVNGDMQADIVGFGIAGVYMSLSELQAVNIR